MPIESFCRFIQLESFDSTPVKWKKNSEKHYWFQIDDLIYDVNFEEDTVNKAIELSFTVDLGSGTTKIIGLSNTGNQFLVASTVMDIWKDYIKIHPEETHYTFTANKSQSKSRPKIYERLLDRYFKTAWIIHKENTSNAIEFHIIKK